MNSATMRSADPFPDLGWRVDQTVTASGSVRERTGLEVGPADRGDEGNLERLGFDRRHAVVNDHDW